MNEGKPGKIYRLHVEGQEKDDVMELLKMIDKYIIKEYSDYEKEDCPHWYDNIKPNVDVMRKELTAGQIDWDGPEVGVTMKYLYEEIGEELKAQVEFAHDLDNERLELFKKLSEMKDE